jgi:hypothetical protein
VLYDKLLFERWCREHGFPVAHTLLEVRAPGWPAARAALAALPSADLFSKPADWSRGDGARRWRYDGRGGYVGSDGRARHGGELLAELAEQSREIAQSGDRLSGRILVQACLRNHRELAALSSGALCTARIQTYRWPGAAARLLAAVYKMPVGEAAADNFHFGGVAAAVELESGRLGEAVHHTPKGNVLVDRHPETGAPIAGRELPYWDEAVRLALRAHGALRHLATVGWDVALTDDGPVLVEGNTVPNPVLVQLASGVPLGRTPFVACINAHMRECFGLPWEPAGAP